MSELQKWDDRYSASELVWSAGPNQFVEELCRDLTPGRAIDLAAGEGRNAVWLAERGWDSTAVDFSGVGLAKAQEIAARRGVEITTIEADLLEYQPESAGYDLVIIAYLHIPPAGRALVLDRAAAAVASGGRLLLIGHDATNIDHGYGGPSDPSVLTSPAEVVASLEEAASRGTKFSVSRAEVADRIVDTDDGPRVAKDTVVLAQRVD